MVRYSAFVLPKCINIFLLLWFYYLFSTLIIRQMLLIYCPVRTARHTYIIDLMLTQLLGIRSIAYANNLADFVAEGQVAKLNYSTATVANVPQVLPHSFLAQTNVEPTALHCTKVNGLMAAFELPAGKSASLPFDVFAWCFYLVSRYEEYLPYEPDQHGRFAAAKSIAYQQDFLSLPLVDLWSREVLKILVATYPDLEYQLPTYRYQATYDIDHAFAFKYKIWWRQLGALARNAKNKNWAILKDQLRTLGGRQADPYFNFTYLQQLDQQFGLQPIYFWLVGNYGKHDKNIDPSHPIFQRLITDNARQFKVGIHPSYTSNEASPLLLTEISRLQDIAKQKITRSRQHYLKLHLPTTYQRLIAHGIKEDYTMGYAQEMGFRASMAQPFRWFDLSTNQVTDLVVYPFQIMDVTLQSYQQLSPEEAIKKATKIIAQTKAVQGTLVTIWHNSSLSERWGWEGWRAVYEAILAEAIL